MHLLRCHPFRKIRRIRTPFTPPTSNTLSTNSTPQPRGTSPASRSPSVGTPPPYVSANSFSMSDRAEKATDPDLLAKLIAVTRAKEDEVRGMPLARKAFADKLDALAKTPEAIQFAHYLRALGGASKGPYVVGVYLGCSMGFTERGVRSWLTDTTARPVDFLLGEDFKRFTDVHGAAFAEHEKTCEKALWDAMRAARRTQFQASICGRRR